MSEESVSEMMEINEAETDNETTSLRSDLSETTLNDSEGEETPFEVPEQYKNEGWAKNYKSMADVWQDLSHAKYAVGKKTIGVPEWDKASEAEIEAYYEKLRPKTADAYNVEELEEDEASFFKEVFFKYGISKKQADSIIADYKAVSSQALEPLYSKQALEQEFKNRFGPSYDKETKKISDFLKKEAGKEDLATLNKLPNSALGILYDMINKVMQRYAVTDTDIGLGTTDGAIRPPEIDYEGYIKEMDELSHKEHTDADKIAIRQKYLGV